MLNGYNNPVDPEQILDVDKIINEDPKIVTFNIDLMHNQRKRIL